MQNGQKTKNIRDFPSVEESRQSERNLSQLVFSAMKQLCSGFQKIGWLITSRNREPCFSSGDVNSDLSHRRCAVNAR